MKYKYINYVYITLLKTILNNGSKRFIVNSYTLHPPNHIHTVRRKINEISVSEEFKNIVKKEFEEGTDKNFISIKNEKKVIENTV